MKQAFYNILSDQ